MLVWKRSTHPQCLLESLSLLESIGPPAAGAINLRNPILTIYTRRHIRLLQNIYRRMDVGEKKTDLLQGTLDLLVLKTLSLGPLHGLGVSHRIEQITKGTFQVKPGSLFPALHRMEEAGWLKSSWGESENNRRAKYYGLTRAGQRQLEAETKDWNRISLAIASALKAT